MMKPRVSGAQSRAQSIGHRPLQASRVEAHRGFRSEHILHLLRRKKRSQGVSGWSSRGPPRTRLIDLSFSNPTHQWRIDWAGSSGAEYIVSIERRASFSQETLRYCSKRKND